MPITFYIAYKGYKSCYQLKSEKSVIEIHVSTQNNFTLALRDSSEINVILIDKLLINKNLMLRFKPEPNDVHIRFKMTRVAFLKHQLLLFYRAVTVFILQDYYYVYLSETTLEPSRFRQLLRRIN